LETHPWHGEGNILLYALSALLICWIRNGKEKRTFIKAWKEFEGSEWMKD